MLVAESSEQEHASRISLHSKVLKAYFSLKTVLKVYNKWLKVRPGEKKKMFRKAESDYSRGLGARLTRVRRTGNTGVASDVQGHQ